MGNKNGPMLWCVLAEYDVECRPQLQRHLTHENPCDYHTEGSGFHPLHIRSHV